MLGRNIKELVITKLEERSPFGNSDTEVRLAGGDSMNEVKPIYDYIDNTIATAADEVLSFLPIHLLPIVPLYVAPLPDESDKATGYISLPNDFLRLHSLKMKGWLQPVHRVTLAHEPTYKKQFNHWSRGTAEKPVVIYKTQPKKQYVLSLLSEAESRIRDTDMQLLL